MSELLPVLSQWQETSRGANVTPVTTSLGFSGANVWRVAADGSAFALRRWQQGMTADRLRVIHTVQSQLAAYGPPVVPRLRAASTRTTFLTHGGQYWELAEWRPGRANFREHPNDARLGAAMRTLAGLHKTAGERIVTPWPLGEELQSGRDVAASARRRSRSVARRSLLLDEIVHGRWLETAARPDSSASVDELRLARDAAAFVQQTAPAELEKAIGWSSQDLPLQFRLGDVHHDHVLFVDDDVSGVIDFGAIDFDAPAGDVARLLGSMVGDDCELWRRGLAAYESVRPMTDVERRSVAFFDSSGTVVSAANWLQWLWPREPQSAPVIANRAAALDRLRTLAGRLQVLAERRT